MLDYDSMPAGREMDALVAEKVMGLLPCSDPVGRCEAAHMTPCQCWGHGQAGSDLRGYSMEIDAACEVVEKMTKKGTSWAFTVTEGRAWAKYFPPGVSAQSVSLSLSICRAALKAVDHA